VSNPTPTPGRHARTLLLALGPFVGLVLVIVLFAGLLAAQDVRTFQQSQNIDGFWAAAKQARAAEDPTFHGFTAFVAGRNFKVILTQTVIVAIGALGMTLIIVSGGIDLSAGSVVALTSVVGAKLLSLDQPWSMPAVLAATVLAGAAVGCVNGTLIGVFRMMPFIVTLGMMGVARGAAKWLGANQAVNYSETAAVNRIMESHEPNDFFPLPWGVWIAVALAGVMTVVLRQTVFGRYVFAIGSNEATARLCGVRVPMHKVIIYALGGLFFGIAGLMQLSRLTQGDPTVAIGLELDIIAAVVIGGASLSGGTGSILGSVIGALIMAVLRNASNQMGWQTYTQEIIIGTVIVLAVAIDRFRQTRQAS
jgi:ribose transport system permease protein